MKNDWKLESTQSTNIDNNESPIPVSQLFTAAMKEFLANNDLLREIIKNDATEAVRFQKDDIQTLITKNLGTKEIRSLIYAIARKTCNAFAASWEHLYAEEYNKKFTNEDDKSENLYHEEEPYDGG